jgi:hypothetical protein
LIIEFAKEQRNNWLRYDVGTPAFGGMTGRLSHCRLLADAVEKELVIFGEQ